MEYSKTLSGALCRIFNEIGPEVFRNPSRLTAYLADFAPNLKAERMQMQMFVDSGCAKQLAVATSADIKQRIAAAVDTLSKLYGMDSKKAEELCNIYVSAMSGREYDAKGFPDAKMQPAKEEAQFRLGVEDVFQIAGRGMVAVGRVRGGTVHVGAPVVIIRANGGK